MEEGRLMQSMLLDFYGELLTDKQKKCFDLHFNEDLSLSEIAEECGISRQGVWDNIRRAEAVLEDVEQKTGLVRRFTETRSSLEQISRQVEKLCGLSTGEAGEIAREIKTEIDELRSQG